MKLQRISRLTLVGGLATLLAGGAVAATPDASTKLNTDPAANPPSQTEKKESMEDRFLSEFQRVEERLDRLFDQTYDKALGELHEFTTPPGFNSAMNVSTENDHYVIKLSLPDRDTGKLDVKVEPNNVLHITAKEEEQNGKPVQPGATSTPKDDEALKSFSLMRYEQMITLPGPVDSSKMHIDRQGSKVTITLPKAEGSQPSTQQ
jgi:HSP20 family molecular chaperone IbpA